MDLLKLNVAPLAVFQMLKSMCAGQRPPSESQDPTAGTLPPSSLPETRGQSWAPAAGLAEAWGSSGLLLWVIALNWLGSEASRHPNPLLHGGYPARFRFCQMRGGPSRLGLVPPLHPGLPSTSTLVPALWAFTA